MGSRTPSLLCLGNLTIDEALQPDGTRTIEPGGDALYAALAARTHLDAVRWLAPIGADFPQNVLDHLAATGLVCAEPARRESPTVRNVVTYLDDGSRTWELVHGDAHFEAMSVSPDDLTSPMLAADGILISAMSPRSQLRLTPWIRQNSTATIFLDVQEDDLEGNEDAWRSIIPCCDVFLPSEVEATTLSGTSDLARALRMFGELGPRIVAIKLAERGCLVLDVNSGTSAEIAVERVEPVDSTGAGDAFCGAFAAATLLGADAERAARAACDSARIAIGAAGIQGLLDVTPARRAEVTVG